MPRQGQYSDTQAKAMLEAYVNPKECGNAMMPRDLKPKVVSDYLRQAITPQSLLIPVKRAVRLVRFYVLRDRVPQLAGLLTGGEKKINDLRRSCDLIVAVGELGAAAEQQAAVKHYERLLGLPLAVEGFPELIETFFSLPPRTPPDALKKRTRAALGEAQKKGPEDQVGQLMNYDIREVPWMLEEKARKDGVPLVKDDVLRRRKWAECYLGYDQKAPFRWEEQAGFYFLADVKGADDAAAVAALRAAMSRIDPSKEDGELVKVRKTRGYRAREYFLDMLNEDEKDDREGNLKPQDDLIM